MITKRWSIDLGRDWVTSIGLTASGQLVVGDRRGNVAVLDLHGNQLASVKLDSWVGAIATMIDRDGNDHIVLGTKRGTVELHSLVPLGDTVELRRHSTFSARNTIRSIQTWASTAGVAYIALGSEDRCLYLGRLDVALSRGLGESLSPSSINGWIRTVCFCFPHRTTREPLVAAGCGDKHIHFFDLEGRHLNSVDCESKVHALVASRDGGKLFASSDSRELFELTPSARKGEITILRKVALPFRASLLEFTDDPQRELLIVGEDGNVVLYDTRASEIVRHSYASGRIFSICSVPSGLGVGPALMVGHAHGELSSSSLSWDPSDDTVIIQAPMSPRVDFTTGDELAQNLLRGPVGVGVWVGIGRFLFVLPTTATPPYCLVGTDEGRIGLIEINKSSADLVYLGLLFPHDRVWSVAGSWRSFGDALVFAATSNKEVAIVSLSVKARGDGEPPDCTATISRRVGLSDWPREIRPTAATGGLEPQVLAGCESGDVFLVSAEGADLLLKKAGVIRTLCCLEPDDSSRIVVGTDDRFFALLVNGTLQWRIETADRVREVIALSSFVIAASEDHFLYVATETGDRMWRFHFPHRVLSIAAIPDDSTGSEWTVAAGCGDGQVYVVNSTGSLVAAYEFPDRIRDVIWVAPDTLVVASEDGHVYPAVHYGAYGTRVSDDLTRHVTEAVDRLKRSGIGVEELSEHTRLVACELFKVWRGPTDDDLILAIIDSLVSWAAAAANIALQYRLARVIVDYGVTTQQFAASRSRITRLVDASVAGSPYPAHAALRAVVDEASEDTFARQLVDVVVEHFPLDDDWLQEELIRGLDERGFMSLGPGGFTAHLNSVHVHLSRLARIMETSASCRWCGHRRGMSDGSAPSLVDFWDVAGIGIQRKAPNYHLWEGRLASLDSTITVLRDCTRLYTGAVTNPGSVVTTVEDLLGSWTAMVACEPLSACADKAKARLAVIGLTVASNPAVTADYIQRAAEYDDPLIGSADFLLYLTCLATLRALGAASK